jgi:four helix bundle protein
MNQDAGKIKEFTDLNAWQKSYDLALFIYKISSKFPKHELFGLSAQIRRAVISVSSNIAEGFGRISYKEKVRFYLHSHASLLEVKSQIYVAKGLEYLNEADNEQFWTIANETHSLIRGLIRATSNRIPPVPNS